MSKCSYSRKIIHNSQREDDQFSISPSISPTLLEVTQTISRWYKLSFPISHYENSFAASKWITKIKHSPVSGIFREEFLFPWVTYPKFSCAYGYNINKNLSMSQRASSNADHPICIKSGPTHSGTHKYPCTRFKRTKRSFCCTQGGHLHSVGLGQEYSSPSMHFEL